MFESDESIRISPVANGSGDSDWLGTSGDWLGTSGDWLGTSGMPHADSLPRSCWSLFRILLEKVLGLSPACSTLTPDDALHSVDCCSIHTEDASACMAAAVVARSSDFSLFRSSAMASHSSSQISGTAGSVTAPWCMGNVADVHSADSCSESLSKRSSSITGNRPGFIVIVGSAGRMADSDTPSRLPTTGAACRGALSTGVVMLLR